jgi:hypothetical protein
VSTGQAGGHSSKDRALVQQAQSPRFNPQYQERVRERERKREMGHVPVLGSIRCCVGLKHLKMDWMKQ